MTRWRRALAALAVAAPLAASVSLAGCASAGATGMGKALGVSGVSGTGRPAPGHPGAKVWSDLAYGTASKLQKLDLYRPAGDNRTLPLIIDIHGGGFEIGDKIDEAEKVNLDALQAAGYATASLNYRLSLDAPYPAAVIDVKAAVRWLRAHAAQYQLDPNRFGVMGESAGGYMSIMLATTANSTAFDDPSFSDPHVSSAVQAVVDWWGPINFLQMDGQMRANPACAKTGSVADDPRSPYAVWFRAPITTVAARVEAADPSTYLPSVRSLPPILIEHGQADCTVPYQQSVNLAAALRAKGGDVTLRILPHAGHGLDFPISAQLPGVVAFFNGALAARK